MNTAQKPSIISASRKTGGVALNSVTIYTSARCRYCEKAKRLLEEKGADYEEVAVDLDEERRKELVERHGWRTVPAVFIDGELVGGYDRLAELDASGELDRILGSGNPPARRTDSRASR